MGLSRRHQPEADRATPAETAAGSTFVPGSWAAPALPPDQGEQVPPAWAAPAAQPDSEPAAQPVAVATVPAPSAPLDEPAPAADYVPAHAAAPGYAEMPAPAAAPSYGADPRFGAPDPRFGGGDPRFGGAPPLAAGAPTGWAPAPPPAPASSGPNRSQLLAVVAVVVVLVVGGLAWVVTRPSIKHVSLPNAFSGQTVFHDANLERNVGPAIDKMREGGVGHPQMHLYSTNGANADLVVLVGDGVRKARGNHNDAFTGAMDGLRESIGHSTTLSAMSAGRFGGDMRCGSTAIVNVPVGMCMWVDRDTFGVVLQLKGDAASAHQQTLSLRDVAEH